ncbi:MAG: pyridoxal phosphate-dependent aminotransferase [Eubacteriaceae bacterium]|nr:pyridoxal phosphate-dependent aminotransferase [Eubacteriaceae bacterium]
MLKPLSEKAMNLVPSVTLELSALTKQLKAEGKDIVSFGIGEPDFNVNDEIKQAAIDAINADYSHYTDVKGIYALREAISERLLRENAIEYSPENIMVTNGAKHALFTCLQALVSDNDEVIIPQPYWVSYSEMVKMAGGVPIMVETAFEDSFLPDAEQIAPLITEKTKVLLINDPINPTGAIFDKNRLSQIAELCVRHGLYIISDEIYDKFIYDGAKHTSIASLGDEVKQLTVTVNGFSKTYAMPGWRLGYAAGAQGVIKAMSSISGQCVSHPSSITQMAGIKALRMDQGFVGEMVKEYDRRRKYMTGCLDKIKGVRYIYPAGAFYIFTDISAFSDNSAQFAMSILKEAGVAVVPGSGFGKEGFIRFSYACSYEDIVKGMERLTKFLSR